MKLTACFAFFPENTSIVDEEHYENSQDSKEGDVCKLATIESQDIENGEENDDEENHGNDTGNGDHVSVPARVTTSLEKTETCPHCQAVFTTKYRLDKHIVNTHLNAIKCPHCSEGFRKKAELKVHYREQHPNEEFPLTVSCGICLELFESNDELHEHKEKVHSHDCEFCTEVFFSAADLDSHIKKVHPDEEPICNVCQAQFDTLKSLRKHKRSVHKRKDAKMKCQDCGKVCSSPYAYYLHERAVHKKVEHYTCDICGKSFTYHNTLKLHKLHHAGERPFKCTVPNCGKSYLSSSHLKGHITAVHSGEKKFVCPVCNKRFPYEHSLKTHMPLHTDQREFICCVCSKGFVTQGALRSHEALHEPNQGSYQCKECGKTYRTPNQLRGHERRHTPDRNRYMCHICGCTFMFRSNLEAHAVVHRTDKTFHCKLCEKSFKTYATLYSHMKVHQTEKPFMCEICAKGFKTKECLKAHSRRHSGEKPFKCVLCKSCFPDKGGLSKHLKTVHSTKPNFQCPACKKKCSRADNLRVHMKSHNDPALLQLSREELMINKDEGEGESARIDMVSVLLESGTEVEESVVHVPTTVSCPVELNTHQTIPQQQYMTHPNANQAAQTVAHDLSRSVSTHDSTTAGHNLPIEGHIISGSGHNVTAAIIGSHNVPTAVVGSHVTTVSIGNNVAVSGDMTAPVHNVTAPIVGGQMITLAPGFSHSLYMMDPNAHNMDGSSLGTYHQ